MSKRGTMSSVAGDDVTPEMILRDLKIQDLETQTEAVLVARGLLCGKDPPVTRMVEAGIITPLVDALDRNDSPNLQYGALAVLTNIAFGTREHTVDVANNGVAPKLMSFLAYDNDLAKLAILMLGSVSLHGAAARHAVLSRGAVRAMLPHMTTDTPVRRLRTFVRAYSNLCSLNDDDDMTYLELVLLALPYIHDILDIEHEESLDPDDKEVPFIACDVIVDACTALTNIMLGPDECIEAVQLVPGLTARLVGLLGHEGAAVREAALSAVGNMLAGTDVQVDRCLDANCLDHIVSLLKSNSPSLVSAAARSTGNVLAGTHAQIRRALEKDILNPLRNILASGDPECRKEAVFAVTCLCCNGSATQSAWVYLSGALQPYCAMLAAEDLAIAGEVLDGLYELMQVIVALRVSQTDASCGGGQWTANTKFTGDPLTATADRVCLRDPSVFSCDCQQTIEEDGYLESLCYMLDDFDVLDNIQLLLERVTDETHRCKLSNMSVALRKHAREERTIVFEEIAFTSEMIVQDLNSSDQGTQMRAVRAASHCVLLEKHPPINALLEAGIMHILVEGLDRDASLDLQYLGAWMVYLTTAKTHKHRMAVVDSGAVPKLIALLVRADEIADLASCSLGNIALHGPETRDAVLAYVTTDTALTELRTYVRAYRNLCSFKEEDRETTEEYVMELMMKLNPLLRAMPLIAVLLDIEDREILVEVCQACTNLMCVINILGEVGVEAVQAVSGLTARLMALMGHEEPDVQGNALVAVGNILACIYAGHLKLDTQIDRCLDHIMSSLQSREPHLVEAACVATCNLLNQTHSPIQEAIAKGILTPLQNILADAEPNCQKQAARAISIICCNGTKATRARLLSSGVLQPLCSLLVAQHRPVLQHALHALGTLLENAEKDDKIKPLCSKLNKIGVLSLLQQLPKQEMDMDLQHKADWVSAILRKHIRKEHLVIEDRKLFTLTEIVLELKAQDLSRQLRAAHAACRLLCRPDAPRTAAVCAGLVAPLVAALDTHDCSELQHLAASALICIIQGTHKHRVAVVNGGAIPKLIPLLSLGVKLAESAAVALACITHRAPVTRDLVLSHGAVRAMLPHMRRDSPPELLRMCVSAYKNLCVDIVSTSTIDIVSPALPFITELLDIEDLIVLESACGAIANLVTGLDESIQVVQAVPGLMSRLVGLLGHETNSIKKAALSAVGNMLAGTDAKAGRGCLEAGCLQLVVPLLRSAEPALAREAAQASHNMLRHAFSISLALDKGIVPPLCHILAVAEPNSPLQYNVVGSLANIIALGTSEHKMAVVCGGAIPKLLPLLANEAAVAGRAIAALGYLAGEGPEMRDMVLAHGAVRAMLRLMRADMPMTLLATCAWAYWNFCRHGDDDKRAVKLELVSPALPHISELLAIGDEDVLEHACRAVGELIKTSECTRIEVVQAVPGLTARLVGLLGHGAADVKRVAIVAVMLMLSGTSTQANRCLDAGCLDHIMSFYYFSEPFQIMATAATRNLLSHTPSHIQRALEKGILAPLLSILTDAEPNSVLQSNVVTALANITSHGTSEHIKAVVDGGAVPKLIALLSHEPTIAEAAVGALANVAWLGSDTRDTVLAHGAVRAILPHMRPDSPLQLLRKCVQAYRNFCRHDDNNPKEKVELVSPALPQITELMSFWDENVVENASQALLNLTKTDEGIEAVQATPGLTTRLLELLWHEAADVKEAAMISVMLMLSGTNAQADRCFDAGCLEHIVFLLQCREPTLLELAVRAAGIIVCNTQPHSRAALDRDILTPLLDILADAEPNSTLQYLATSVLAAGTERGTPEHRKALIEGGGIPKLIELLSQAADLAGPAALILGCIAGDEPETRDTVLAHGAVRAMLPHMSRDSPPELLTMCLAAYKNFCRHHDDKQAVKLELVSPALPLMSELLAVEDEDVLEQVCWALVELARRCEGVEAVQSTPGLTTRLVGLLGHEGAAVREAATVAVMTALWTLYSRRSFNK